MRQSVKEPFTLHTFEEHFWRITFLQKWVIPALILYVTLPNTQMNCCLKLVTDHHSFSPSQMSAGKGPDRWKARGKGVVLGSQRAILGSQSSWTKDFRWHTARLDKIKICQPVSMPCQRTSFSFSHRPGFPWGCKPQIHWTSALYFETYLGQFINKNRLMMV